jgi:hypothetical protein
MDTLERIRRGYEAMGPGAHRDVVRMFDEEHEDQVRADEVCVDDLCNEQACDDPSCDAAEPAGDWVVVDLFDRGSRWASREVPAQDLFGSLPPHWELLGVDIERWVVEAPRLVVQGHYRARPRASQGRWQIQRVPFVHIWTFSEAGVEGVYSYLDGIELRRQPAAA